MTDFKIVKVGRAEAVLVEREIKHAAARFTFEMAVHRRISVVAILLLLNSDYRDNALLGKQVERVVDRGSRQRRDLGDKPLVDRVFPFDQIQKAFARLAEGPMGKVLLKIR